MRENYYPCHKYSSPFASWLDEQHADEDAGDIETDGVWIGRYGEHHALVEDSQGFVDHVRLRRGSSDWDRMVERITIDRIEMFGAV